MMSRRLIRWTSPVWLPLVFLLTAFAGQTTDTARWDPARTTEPSDLADLKALQESVRRVVDKCTPATVGLLIGMGAGSGVIVSEDGLVLTAAHVSGEPGRTCTVILHDGRRVKGKTLGTNDKMDSGMVRIIDKGPDDGKWPYLPIGKAADLKRGQWVVALGHPGGYKKDRPPVARLGRIQTVGKDLVRSDCTLVGGDSGGPLFDLNGTVVGIHSRIGLSLAANIHVPSEQFKKEWDQLAAGEQIGRPPRPADAVLGVTFAENSDQVKVDEVYDGGPAYKAGLKAGDVILRFDEIRVGEPEDVRGLLRKRKPGDEVELVVRRGERTLTLTVTLGKRE
jgi:serine protease Do